MYSFVGMLKLFNEERILLWYPIVSKPIIQKNRGNYIFFTNEKFLVIMPYATKEILCCCSLIKKLGGKVNVQIFTMDDYKKIEFRQFLKKDDVFWKNLS